MSNMDLDEGGFRSSALSLFVGVIGRGGVSEVVQWMRSPGVSRMGALWMNNGEDTIDEGSDVRDRACNDGIPWNGLVSFNAVRSS